MSRKTNMSDLFPDDSKVAKAMRAAAPTLTRCPGGHDLPHRTVWGRCLPILCLDAGEAGTKATTNRESEHHSAPYREEMDALPRGMEQTAIHMAHGPQGTAEEVEGQSKEAGIIMRAIGQTAARSGVMYVPDVPPADPVKPGEERGWTEKRLDQLLPLAIAQFEYDLKYGSNEVRREAAKRISGMRGFSEKAEGIPDMRGPVVILHMGRGTPYDAQQAGRPAIQGEYRHVRQVEDVGGYEGAGEGDQGDPGGQPG